MTINRNDTMTEVGIDAVAQNRDSLDNAWLAEHLNMEIALRAYERGVLDTSLGQTDTTGHATPEKLECITTKIILQHLDDATFSLEDDEIRETLCLFPESWLRHAILKSVTVRPPAHFVTKKYGDHYFVAGIEEMQDGEKKFNGERVTEGFYEANALTPPSSVFHYAPGQYIGSNEDILLFQEPAFVRESVSADALKQYGRELIVHEFLHSVLREDADIVFVIDGMERVYESVLSEFHAICQREKASVSEYSELYAPLLSRPFALDDFWVKMGLQEELGELLSSTMLGWGATPRGIPKKPSERDFGGTAFAQTGKSEKLAFSEKLLAADVRKKIVLPIIDDTAQQVREIGSE